MFCMPLSSLGNSQSLITETTSTVFFTCLAQMPDLDGLLLSPFSDVKRLGGAQQCHARRLHSVRGVKVGFFFKENMCFLSFNLL